MSDIVAAPFQDDVAQLLEWGYERGAKLRFYDQIRLGDERVGQAFMNVLRIYDPDSYARLAGSNVDPFYVDSKIPAALDRLTSK